MSRIRANFVLQTGEGLVRNEGNKLIKKTTTVYSLTQPAGTSLTVHLESDFIVIRNVWANGEIESEVNIHASRGTAADLVTVFSELEAEVIGE